jgi:hypothetical protein
VRHPFAEAESGASGQPGHWVVIDAGGWQGPPPLDPDRRPWYAILCVALTPLLVVLWPLRLWQLLQGDLDWWGGLQLVGASVSLPACVWQAARLRRWWVGRRHSIPA